MDECEFPFNVSPLVTTQVDRLGLEQCQKFDQKVDGEGLKRFKTFLIEANADLKLVSKLFY